MANDFSHTPLDLASRQIRLLRIVRDSPEAPISCRLKTYDIMDANLYIALSYTWGADSPTHSISINGFQYLVRQNLWDFLLIVRDRFAESLFWIDQICIDQRNTQEKNHQVRLMGDVYKDALYVIAWLGTEDKDSDLAIDFISTLPREDDWYGYGDPRSERDKWPGHRWNMSQRLGAAVEAIFARPYWSRLWIVQEVWLARQLVFLCGPKQFSYFTARNFVMDQHWHCEPNIAGPQATKLLAFDCLEYSGDKNDPNGSYARSFLTDPFGGPNALDTFRKVVYMYCDFGCADPRDKIYGLFSIGKNASMEIDYNRTTEEVFWAFFRSHLNGLSYNRTKTGSPLNLPIEFLHYWLHFSTRLLDNMGLISRAILSEVVEVLEEKMQDYFDSLWWLPLEKQVDISHVLCEYLAQYLTEKGL